MLGFLPKDFLITGNFYFNSFNWLSNRSEYQTTRFQCIYSNYRRSLVRPYPSRISICPAEKTFASLGCKAAPPETITRIFPPSPSLHLLKTSLLASVSCCL